MKLGKLTAALAVASALAAPAFGADAVKIGFITKFPVPFYTTMSDAAKAYAA
ncbi:MAG: sugar ABC transporter substrate-binding protein, partial [Bradyrhizobium sp.]